jgi:hypothetical protein
MNFPLQEAVRTAKQVRTGGSGNPRREPAPANPDFRERLLPANDSLNT